MRYTGSDGTPGVISGESDTSEAVRGNFSLGLTLFCYNKIYVPRFFKIKHTCSPAN
jgi:hypothetical protein